jgi:hypothetical protein
MRVLFRVAATLLIAVPLFVALVIMFMVTALAPDRRGSLSPESGTSRSLERGATGGSSRRATGAVAEVSR